MKVAINAAAGGSDSGISANGIVEKDITLEMAKIIEQKLKENNIDVLMLRDNDTTISYDDRIAKLKREYPDIKDVIVLSNTMNSGGGSGIEIIYPLNEDNSLANLFKDSLSYFNDTRSYQLRWPTDTSKDYYYITRSLPGYETIIIRYGYLDNKKDADIIKNNYKDMAEAVADTIIEYVNGKNTYVVKSGDTLYGIAQKFGVSLNDLKEVNNLVNNNLSINQVLKIPSKVIKEESPVVTDTKYQYVVKAGDTLYGIAKKYNINVNKLKDINNKKNNNLSIGEILNLYAKYKIKSGDTLYSIAKKYSTSVEQIKELNDLKNNVLTIGNYLYIP